MRGKDSYPLTPYGVSGVKLLSMDVKIDIISGSPEYPGFKWSPSTDLKYPKIIGSLFFNYDLVEVSNPGSNNVVLL